MPEAKIGLFWSLIFVAAVAGVAPAAAQQKGYEERFVSFSVGPHEIVGVLTKPAAEPVAVVLILHGMSGNRDGPQIRGDARGLFERAAQLWAENGVASLRISTGGRGGSEGSFEDMTFTRRTGEAAAALDWLSGQADLRADNVVVLGHSQGAIIAAALAKRLNSERRIRSVVMWAPNVDPLTVYRGVMGEAAYQRGLNAGPDETVAWRGAGGTQRRFRSGFFRDLSKFDTSRDIAGFSGELLVVTGSRDRISPTWRARKLRNHHPDGISLVELDVGHRMGASQGLADAEMVAGHTLDWLLAEKSED